MKTNITLTIDIEKKELFEKLKTFHEMTFSDALDLGLDTILNNTSNEDFLKFQINETKIKLEDLEKSLENIRKLRELKLADLI